MADSHSKSPRASLQECNVVRFVGKRAGQVVIACKTCGTEFIRYASHPNVFCSKACAGKVFAERYASKRLLRICNHCNETFFVPPASKAKYCCLKCKQTAVSRRTAKTRAAKMRGKGSGIGGGIKPTTYQKLNGRHAHRVIAEQQLGRELLPGEIVHHIDENRHNNHPDNLQVMTQSEHARLHFTKNRLCEYPGCDRKHAAKGLCMMHWRRARKGKLTGYLTASDEH